MEHSYCFCNWQSSELLSPNIIKKLIISRHLKDLDEKRMANFKKALCQLKPRRGAGLIKMEYLKNKSIEEIVDFIFRCHTERHGASTVIKTLKEINENQIRTSIEKALKNGGYTIMLHNIFFIRLATPTNVSIISLILQPGETLEQVLRHLS